MNDITIKTTLATCQGFYAPGKDHTPGVQPADHKRDEIFADLPPPPIYKITTEHKVTRWAKSIFSILFLPTLIYNGIHKLLGKIVIPVVSRDTLFIDPSSAYSLHEKGWKMKRVAIQVDNIVIDAFIVGKKSTLTNGRWTLVSNGKEQTYQNRINSDDEVRSIAEKINSNILYFNYPGMDPNSQSSPERSTVFKAYRGMMRFLEDKNLGIGAREIIAYGYSMGGGLQSAMEDHKLQKGVKHLFIKDRTYSSLSGICAEMTTDKIMGTPPQNRPDFKAFSRKLIGKIIASLVQFFGWDYNTIRGSRKLRAPEIILQTTYILPNQKSEPNPKKLQRENDVADDGVISARSSLAVELLRDKITGRSLKWAEEKEIYGLPIGHTEYLSDKQRNFIAERINARLKTAPI